MFYKKGIDITNDKSMFNFLHDHFRYDTMSSWNCLESIANNVKVYNLDLDGDDDVALKLLENDDYMEISSIIENWEYDHKGYTVGFNGRSGGYLVLYSEDNNKNILPDYIADYDYEDYKQYCKDYNGSVRGNRYELRELTKLVQDFDKLCDELRDYTNELSKIDYCKCVLENAVEEFNVNYEDDLTFCGFDWLSVNDDGKVYIGEIKQLECLMETFMKFIKADTYSYKIKQEDDYLWVEDN